MNRRDFIKFSVLTGIAASLPLQFLVDNRDDETKFLEYILSKYDDELVVIDMIKNYGYANSNGMVVGFLKPFCERQPNVIAWLKSRIDIRDKNSRWAISRRTYRPDINYDRALLYNQLALRFNLKPLEEITLKAMKLDISRFT